MSLRRRRPYPWPASRLSRERDVMHSLHLESKRTGRPITAIIEEAVCTHLETQMNLQIAESRTIGFETASSPSPQTVA